MIMYVKMNEAHMYTQCKVGERNVAAATCATLDVGKSMGRWTYMHPAHDNHVYMCLNNSVG